MDDFTFPALFSRRVKAYYEKFKDVPMNDLAYVSVKAYSNANLNPLAHMQAVKMSLENASTASDKNPNFLSNKELSPYLRYIYFDSFISIFLNLYILATFYV